MTSSNLARRLEEYEATLKSLQLTIEPETRQLVAQDAPVPSSNKPRRRARTGGIRVRNQGFRLFRVS